MGKLTAREKAGRIWQRQVDQAQRPIRCYYCKKIYSSCPEQGCVMLPKTFVGISEVFVQSAEVPGCGFWEGEERFGYLMKGVLEQPIVIRELELLLKRAAHFPGSLNQAELQRAEELIAAAEEGEDKCAICGDPKLKVGEPLVCRFHARGLLYRDPKDW